MNIPLNIDWQQILLHLFNFAILAGGLYFLLFKPVKNFMEKRTAHYREMDEEAAGKQRRAQELEEEYQKRLDAAEAEIGSMKAQAAKDAEKLAEMTVNDANAQKEQILAQAREAAEHEKQKAIQQAREEIVQLAVAAAGKILDGEKPSHEGKSNGRKA